MTNRLRRVRDWVVSIPLVVAFGLTLAIYHLVGVVARWFGIRPFERVMAALQRTLMWVFRIAGTKIEIERHPDVRPGTGYAIISNHQSMLDIVLIGGILFTNYPKYVAKKELARGIPSVSLNLRRGGNALIDRKDRAQALRAIKEMATEAQRRGVSIVIFPEGTRSRDGRLQPFKPAGTRVMLEAAPDLPVVPVAVDGSWKLFEHNLLPVPFGETVRIRIGAPIPRRPGDAAEVLESARRQIEQTLAEWRSSAEA